MRHHEQPPAACHLRSAASCSPRRVRPHQRAGRCVIQHQRGAQRGDGSLAGLATSSRHGARRRLLGLGSPEVRRQGQGHGGRGGGGGGPHDGLSTLAAPLPAVNSSQNRALQRSSSSARHQQQLLQQLQQLQQPPAPPPSVPDCPAAPGRAATLASLPKGEENAPSILSRIDGKTLVLPSRRPRRHGAQCPLCCRSPWSRCPCGPRPQGHAGAPPRGPRAPAAGPDLWRALWFGRWSGEQLEAWGECASHEHQTDDAPADR